MSYPNAASKYISTARTRFCLILATVAIAIVFMPSISLGAVKNCPHEPAATTIVSGDDYAGANCVLYTPGDVDSFVFSANAGDTWQIILAYQGGTPGTCMALYDPNGKEIYPNNCTGDGDLVVSQTLSLTGKYTMNLTMEGDSADGDYALSLERINPFPPEAQELTLASPVGVAFAPANEQKTYTFYGATTGTYLVSVSYTGGENGTCAYLYYSGSATPQASPDQGCTGDGVFQFTFKPPKTGTYMLLLTGQGDGPGGDYSIEVSCYLSPCQAPPPPTACADALSYDSTTEKLTMDFTLGTPIAVTWDVWLVSANTIHFSGNTTHPLWSVSQPITEPETSVTKTEGVAKVGRVGVLSIFTTPAEGITCSSWVTVNTGGS
jgi:hypothetical protein